MEWIVPILFVLATAVQWWIKHRHVSEDSLSARSQEKERPGPPAGNDDPVGDLGDLLEALGRGRHESPPPPVLPDRSAPMAPPRVHPKTNPPPFHLPPLPLDPIQDTPVLSETVTRKSPDVKQKSHPSALRDRTIPRLGSRLREAVVLSEILAPPLALR